ncbi:hypothetical protein ACFCYM_27665, partial [Streptomyces sp. NPDC056254]
PTDPRRIRDRHDHTGPPGRVTEPVTRTCTRPEDHIGRFLTECCITDGTTGRSSDRVTGDLKVEQGLLYAAYSSWCSTGEGIRPATARAFATRVRQELSLASPADMMKSSGKKYYPGLALLAEDESEPADV